MTDRIQLADEAEREIATSMARVAGSDAPTIERTYGEIDLAYKLNLIDYARRDMLLNQLREIASARRKILLEERNARILVGAEGVKHWWPEEAAKAAKRGEA